MIKTFANITIDHIQDGKKQFVSTFVRHKDLAEPMNTFVEKQREYTKAFVASLIDAVTEIVYVVVLPSTYNIKV